MRQLLNRQVVGIVLMSLLLVLAGCNSGGGGTPTPTATPANNSTSSPSGSTTANVSGELSVDVYNFSDGESYTYNTTFLGSPSTNVWNVQSVEDGVVTVEAIQSTGGGSTNATFSGNQSSIMKMAAAQGTGSPAEIFVKSRAAMALQGVVSNASAGTEMQLTADNLANPDAVSWSEATLTVGETSTVNGVECTQATLEEKRTSNACINPEYPFPLSLSVSQSGQTVLTMELVNATRP